MTEKVTQGVLRGALLTFASLSLFCLPVVVGCSSSEPAVERSEEDIQKAREEHGRIMLEEAKGLNGGGN